MTDAEYLSIAMQDNPGGATCGFCGRVNDFADDCGFFYIMRNPGTQEKSEPACQECFRGEHGRKHQAYYGVGER